MTTAAKRVWFRGGEKATKKTRPKHGLTSNGNALTKQARRGAQGNEGGINSTIIAPSHGKNLDRPQCDGGLLKKGAKVVLSQRRHKAFENERLTRDACRVEN